MDSFLNPFKRGLLEQRRQVGLWMTTGSATMTEIAAEAGLGREPITAGTVEVRRC